MRHPSDPFEMAVEHVVEQKRPSNLRTRASIEADLKAALTKLLEPEVLMSSPGWDDHTTKCKMAIRAWLTALLDERSE